MKKELTPKDIVRELDKYIISQEEAKKYVAISLRNRDRRKKIKDKKMQTEITPKNVILIGATGIGKTEIARRIAKIVNAPFIKVEATKYTEVGYVGKDVESIIKDLAEITFKKEKEKTILSLKENSYERAIEQIGKILMPKSNASEFKKIIKDIKERKYDDKEIEIETNKKHIPPMIEVIGGPIDENTSIGAVVEQVIGVQMGGAFMPPKEKLKMKVCDAIKRLSSEDAENRLNLQEIREKVVENIENNGIVFIDEIDKIAERNGGDRGEVSRQGVQRDILPIIEGCTVMTNIGAIKTDHILFIAAGAFTQSSPNDMMPELQGRFPIKVKLKNLEKSDFVKILTKVEYNLLEQYKAMMATDGVEISFSKTGINMIAELSVKFNETIENIGARRLSAIVEEVLKDIMYNAPYANKKKIEIDDKFVKKVFNKEVKNENFEKFIL